MCPSYRRHPQKVLRVAHGDRIGQEQVEDPRVVIGSSIRLGQFHDVHPDEGGIAHEGRARVFI